MDAVHIHLIMTHFPIVGTIIGVAILAYGLFSKNDSIIKVALSTFIVMSILTIPVYLTGDGAEDAVENLAGVSKDIIEQHEELAEKAIWLMGLLGVMSLGGLFSISKKMASSKTLTTIIFIVSLLTFGLFAQVGNLGGQIRHSEISSNSTNIQNESSGDVKANSTNDKEDKKDKDKEKEDKKDKDDD